MRPPSVTAPAGMAAIPAGSFRMGSDDFYADERPAHVREVAAFLIDRHPVRNLDFARFVADTGYVTVAERELDHRDFPGADPADLVPGAMVFTPTSGPVDLRDWRQWWRWQPGAMWSKPEGPGSTIDDRMTHPVVHVAYEDASAYASWAGKRLPTEAEHEYAALGGRPAAAYAWGDDPYPDGSLRAHTWIGRFPYAPRGEFVGGTAPVGRYPANDYGLVDMIGNVWEWTTDFYAPRHRISGASDVDQGARPSLLAEQSREDGFTTPRRVLKGGSHLCTPEYCLRFRPAARSPQSEDTGMSHIGFRCAKDA